MCGVKNRMGRLKVGRLGWPMRRLGARAGPTLDDWRGLIVGLAELGLC